MRRLLQADARHRLRPARALRHEQVNYVGALHLLDAVLPVLLRQGSGHLSLMSSVSGYRGLPKALAYGPTKAALINLAECLYFDLTDRGIGVSVISPGFVRHAADRPERVPHARTDQAPSKPPSRSCAAGRRGKFEIHFPKRFTLVRRRCATLTTRCTS